MPPKNPYTKEERIKRWLRWNVYPTFVPILLAILYDFISYNFDVKDTVYALHRHYLDVVLVSFALTAATFAAATDRERNLSNEERSDYFFKALSYGSISIFVYLILYITQNTLEIWIKNIFFAIFGYIAISIVRLGKEIEKSTMP